MMKYRTTLFATALLLAVSLTACRTEVRDEPGAFTYRGLAVHPAAVAELYRSTTGQLNLDLFKTRLEFLEWEDQPGWWLADFGEDPVTGQSPFFAYAAFAAPPSAGSELYVLAVTFNQGNTGDVNNIVLLQKSGPWLGLLRSWNEGSACNGGIITTRLEGETFLYSRELTTVDLLELALDVKLDINPHEDLEATSESCYAAANCAYHIIQDQEELVSVRLYDEPKADEKGRTERFRYQSCFNRLFNSYLSEGKTALSPKEVEEFARRFRDDCLPAK